MSRAHFLRLLGTGVGLSFVPASLAVLEGRASSAQTTAAAASGAPKILGGEGYPIGIWGPPPADQTTVERYREIGEAGFNFVIGGSYRNDDEVNRLALDASTASNLRFLLTDGRL